MVQRTFWLKKENKASLRAPKARSNLKFHALLDCFVAKAPRNDDMNNMAKLKYGLIGYPVKHSLSPAMHNAAFKEFGIDAKYSLYEVKPEELEAFLKKAPEKFSGFNVTIPHKIKTLEYLKKHGSVNIHAERLGAVNTVKVSGTALSGFNTDGPGFYRSLQEDLKFEPENKNIFVLGAGGAARAVVMYLGNGPKQIFVSDVAEAQLKDLKAHYAKYYDDKKLVAVKPGDIKSVLGRCDLLVNATPIGMKDTDPLPVDENFLHSGLCVYDLVYNRPVTELVKKANSRKLHAVTGRGMLVNQGAIAFNLWTGQKIDDVVKVMRKALNEALKEK